MYSPTQGRFISNDPIGFQAGDVNLYRFVGNDPVNMVDPTGLAEIVPEPRWVTEGEGEPPLIRYPDTKAPPITYKGKLYQYQGNWDPVQFTKAFVPRVVFKNQQSKTAGGKTIVEDAEVKAWAARRFPDKIANATGDHVAYVVVQIRFFSRKCVDEKNKVMELPDRWKQIGFSLNYGVFLHAVPPALDTETKKMVINKDDTWSTFVDRFIAIARAINEPGK